MGTLEKYFCNNEQSLKLRKMGFNDVCLRHFELSNQHGYVNMKIPRPLRSQAFDFFREKYNADTEFYGIYDDESKKYDYHIVSDIFETEVDFNDGQWEKFEDMESACIDRLISLFNIENN